jgi:hypothetical protein
VRSVPLLLTGRVRTPQHLQRLHRRLDDATGRVHRAAVGGQVALGTLAAVAAFGVGGA